jgi:hypothetical protein
MKGFQMYKMDYQNSEGYCGLEYKSPKEQEVEINSNEDFNKYFFSLYRCMPNEECDLNTRRNKLRIKHPELVIPVGDNFVLTGQAACEILSAHYYSLSLVEDYEEDVKKYYFKRYETVKDVHNRAKSLPIPMDLTEGQLGTDRDFDFYIKEAIVNKMLSVWKDEKLKVDV